MECSTGRHRKPSPPADQRCGIPRAHHRPMRTPSLPQILLVGLAMSTGIKDALGEHGRPRRLVTSQSTGSNPVRIAILGPKCCGVTHLPCKQENWVELPVDPPMGTWPRGKAPGSQPGKRPPPDRTVHWTVLLRSCAARPQRGPRGSNPVVPSMLCGYGGTGIRLRLRSAVLRVRLPVSAPNAEGASLGGATVCKTVARDSNGVRFPASAPTSGRSAAW